MVADLDGMSIGNDWGRIESADPQIAHLYQMWIAPEHRDRDAGRLLLDAAIAWAREIHAAYLELGVTYRNSPTMRRFTRAGFSPVGELQPLRPGSEIMGQTMRLRLDYGST